MRDAARTAGVPAIYTKVVYQKHALNGGRFFQKAKPLRHFLEGSPLGAWPAGLDVSDDELVVSKQYPSAFFGTSLASTLTTWGIDTLIITGLTTSGCVRASCLDACCHGSIPIVVREGCGDRHEAPHEANLFDMNAKYADVVSEQEVLAYIAARKEKTIATDRGSEVGKLPDRWGHRDIEQTHRPGWLDRAGSRFGAGSRDGLADQAGHDLCDDRGRRQHRSDGANGRRDLSAKFGKTFVVENRPSAGGAAASGPVVSAAPDGYTLLFTPNSAILLTPLVQKMNFDPDNIFTPVTNVGTGSQVVAVKRSLPVNNLAEFLAYAKANPRKLNYAVAGPTTSATWRRCCCSNAPVSSWSWSPRAASHRPFPILWQAASISTSAMPRFYCRSGTIRRSSCWRSAPR